MDHAPSLLTWNNIVICNIYIAMLNRTEEILSAQNCRVYLMLLFDCHTECVVSFFSQTRDDDFILVGKKYDWSVHFCH